MTTRAEDGQPSMEEIGESVHEIVDHVDKYRPIDDPAKTPGHCPYCGDSVLTEINSFLGKWKCQSCQTAFDVSTGISGVRHLRSFIVLTNAGPKLIIGPQHLEHLMETDEMEIPAAGWFGNASVGLGHALRMGKIPSVELDEAGILIEDMEVILITSSIWHHKQYAKASGYFLHYHPDEVFSEIRRADVFMATKLGLALDVSDKQRNAILEAYLSREWDTVKQGSRMAASAVNAWATGDSAAVPEEEEDEWEFNWKHGLGLALVVGLCIILVLWMLGVLG